MITLTLKQPVDGVPLEAESICPDVMVGLDNSAVRALPVYLGKRERHIDDFFSVDGEASDEIVLHGDLKKVRWIGRGMTRGTISIDGNAGMHLGAYMKGGTIEVSGSASDWVGGEMSGGLIRVAANVGGQIGAAYRGSLRGMTDGRRRRIGGFGSRHAHEARADHRRGSGQGLRWPRDEGRHHRVAQRS